VIDMRLGSLSAILLASAAACDSAPFTTPMTLGGTTVDAATLNRGYSAYKGYCAACHGDDGDGLGGQGLHQKIQPRDLRLGILKFAGVPKGSPPRDEDIVRVASRGLKGTPMLPWGVPEADLKAIALYTRTFSEKRRAQAPGEAIEPGSDPWSPEATPERKGASGSGLAVVVGRNLYHGKAKCIACHPAYAPLDFVAYNAGQQGLADADWQRTDLTTGLSVPSDFGYPLHSTDFAHDTLKVGRELPDLYRVIAAGVGGTAMPTWKGQLSDRELWALAAYVRNVAVYAGDRR
jgi:mono/diheme cytochrome c family protein